MARLLPEAGTASAPDRVALHAARIGASAHLISFDPRAGDAAFRPVVALLRLVPAGLEIAQHRIVETAFEHHLARACGTRPEARRPVFGVERRRVDRLLDAHVV